MHCLSSEGKNAAAVAGAVSVNAVQKSIVALQTERMALMSFVDVAIPDGKGAARVR